MKIISPFKDYYDHVAELFGGGDPKVTYVRSTVKPAGRVEWGAVLDPLPWPASNEAGTIVREYAALVICGNPILVERQVSSRNFARTFGPNPIVTDETFEWRVVPGGVVPETRMVYLRPRRTRKAYPFMGPERQSAFRRLAVELIQAPVFLARTWRGRGFVLIEEHVPMLGRIPGIAATFPAEQIYQEIGYFLGNTIHPNPDGSPEPIISNEDKIVSQGFDPKRSFRPKMR